MNESGKSQAGAISWTDLTVPNADQVRDFYREVVGWQVAEFDMGGYSDYCMNLPENGKTAAGICHTRGVNADLPPVWLVYINVEDLNASVDRCTSLGGKVISGPKEMGEHGRICVIQDPAGAFAALFQPAG